MKKLPALAWWRWQGYRVVNGGGLPVATALGIAVLAGVFYVQAYLPLQEHLAQVQQEAQGLRSRVAARRTMPKTQDPTAQLAEFYRFFPAEATMTETLERVFAAAALEGITLEQGEYRLADDAGARLKRYDLSFPVKGMYPKVRTFIARVLQENPSLALEGISFNRQKAMDIGIDAQLRLTLYLAPGAQP